MVPKEFSYFSLSLSLLFSPLFLISVSSPLFSGWEVRGSDKDSLLNQTSVKFLLLLLLLLSRFSRVRLCATPETAAHQAPLSLGFSRQEHWSALPLPSPMHESEK